MCILYILYVPLIVHTPTMTTPNKLILRLRCSSYLVYYLNYVTIIEYRTLNVELMYIEIRLTIMAYVERDFHNNCSHIFFFSYATDTNNNLIYVSTLLTYN